MSRRSQWFLSVAMVLLGVGCPPTRGTMPFNTWRPDAPAAQCSPGSLADPHGRGWTAAGRARLEADRDAGKVTVVSALGCRVEVLEHCRLRGAEDGSGAARLQAGDSPRAGELEGNCEGATHVVSQVADAEPTFSDAPAAPTFELTPLSVEGFDLTGKWRGVIHQPNGPYELYSATIDLVQRGNHVTGVSHLRTSDNEYWANIRIDGRLVGNTLFFADVEMIDQHTSPFLMWCAKGGYFIVDPHEETMSGPVTAPSCEPGTFEVTLEHPPEAARAPHDR
jgi:hypothetical protein